MILLPYVEQLKNLTYSKHIKISFYQSNWATNIIQSRFIDWQDLFSSIWFISFFPFGLCVFCFLHFGCY